MHRFTIDDITIQFPYEPEEMQKTYMERVLTCLKNRSNGMLEAPPMTGKTLALFCPILAWKANEKTRVKSFKKSATGKICDSLSYRYAMKKDITPHQRAMVEETRMNAKAKIIYVSSSHTLLRRARRQLRMCEFPGRAVVLGSRDRLCAHPDVSTMDGGNAAKTDSCLQKVKVSSCGFYNRVEDTKARPELRFERPLMDIEDLVSVGHKLNACPYYLSKEMIQSAEVIFVTYKYLLTSKQNELDLHNSICIFDEAQHLAKACEDSCSSRMRSSDVSLAILETTSIIEDGLKMDGEDENEVKQGDVLSMQKILLNLQKEINALPDNSSSSHTTYEGTYIFKLLNQANITHSHLKVLVWISIQFYKANNKKSAVGLLALIEFLKKVYAGTGSVHYRSVAQNFRLYIEDEEQTTGEQSTTTGDKRADGRKKAKVLNFCCVNPRFAMRQIMDSAPRNIIFTSSILAPLQPLSSELKIPVKVTLEYPHLIGRSKLCVRVVSHGPDRVELLPGDNNCCNSEYITSVGGTVLSFCPVIPGGLIVFFPSVRMLKQCMEKWKASNFWAQINHIKMIFVEPHGKEGKSLTRCVDEYHAYVREPTHRGAIFMTVCQGNAIELLDFRDGNCRAIMIIGLPFPLEMDPRVAVKKEYLDKTRTQENELMSGDDWAELEMCRAVNQAISRIVRHKHDYGSILLCDSRFQQPRQHVQLPSWIKTYLPDDRPTGESTANRFGKVIGDLFRYYRMEEKLSDEAAKLFDEEMYDPDLGKHHVVSSYPIYGSEFRISDYLIPPQTNNYNPTGLPVAPSSSEHKTNNIVTVSEGFPQKETIEKQQLPQKNTLAQREVAHKATSVRNANDHKPVKVKEQRQNSRKRIVLKCDVENESEVQKKKGESSPTPKTRKGVLHDSTNQAAIRQRR